MLDIKFVRENPDIVKKNIENKFQQQKLPLVDEVIELDAKARATQQEADDLRANRNKISKQIGALMAQGKKEEADAVKEQVTKNAERLAELEKLEAELGEKVKKIMMIIPNIIDPSVPIGKDDSENVEIQRYGEPFVPEFEVPYHTDIMERFDGIDLDSARKVAGNGFYYLMGDIARLHSAAISAVSLVDAINILIVQAFFALASGGTVVCSHYLGCEKKERATNAARQLVFITFAMSLVIAIACHLFSNQLLGVIFGQVEPAVMDNAKKYFFFSAMSYPFIALYDDGACILRAQENSKLPMQISFVANGINVALNLIFVWVLHLGVAGSSAATMIARAFAMVAVLYKLRNPKMKIQLRDYSSIRPEWEEIKRILHIGVPSGIENGMFQFGKLAIQSTVSLMGTAAIAAQGMTNIIENLNGIMSIGMGIGLMTVVGECLGAGEKEEAVYYIKKISIAAEVVLIATCLLMFGLTYPITYFGGMEPESAKLCIFMVTCITIVKPIVWIMAFIPPYGFRAAGDVRFTMTTSMLCMWFCRVVLAMVLARVFHMGPIAVWIGMFTDWTIRGIIYTIRFKNRKWLAHQVI